MIKPLHLTTFLFFSFIASTLQAQLNGNYVIDPSGAGDYSSLSAAAAALNNEGMSGNVTLVLANGVYAEQVLFEIPDQTESEILTIESLSGNEEDVVFRYEEAVEDTNYQMAFQDINNLVIRNLSINTEDLEYGRGIELKGECSNVLIENIHHQGNRNDEAIIGDQGIVNWDSLEFIAALPIHNLTVKNSYFREASPCISIGMGYVTQDSEPSTDVQILNNTFEDADALALKFVENVRIEGNIAYGVEYEVQPFYIENCTGTIAIIKNKIWQSFNALNVKSCIGTADNPIRIANNFISGTDEMINILSNEHLHFVYNSVYADVDSYVLRPFNNIESKFQNNIFYQNNPDGTLFYVSPSLEQNASYDFNNLYSNGSYCVYLSDSGLEYLTYQEYLDITGWEANGINVQPIFTLPGEDLHAANAELNAAIPLAGVLVDIDGEMRSTFSPSIGADEINGVIVTNDLTVEIVTTSGDLVAGEQLTINWFGANAGSTTFFAPWIDRIYLSEDTILDDFDTALADYQVQNDLEPFASYSRQNIVGIPLDIVGTKYVIVRVDAEINLIEDNENNIGFSAPITITPPALPNLVVTAIEMPESVFSGTQLQIDFTITNIGNAPASGAWTEYVWYEDEIEGFDQGLYHLLNDPFAQASNIVGLMPGESYQGSIIAETPYITQGYSYIRVETDADDNIVEELDANDNFSTALIDSVFINQSPLADLIIEDIQVPAESFAGEEITISFTVKNNGTATTSPVELPYYFYFGGISGEFYGDWIDYTYLSDTLIDFEPYQRESLEIRYGNLKVDSTYTVIETIQLPECDHGDFFLTIKIDQWNHVAELSEANNWAISDTIQILMRPAPDLIPTSTDPLSGLASNSSYTFSYQVHNQGADTASGYWKDWVFLSDSATFQYDLDELVSVVDSNITIAPNGHTNRTIDIEIPPEIYGDKYLYLWIDGTNNICEQPYDTNNVIKMPLHITQSPSADLEISFNPFPNAVVAGDQLNLSAQVFNAGGAVPNIPVWNDQIFLITEGGALDTAYQEVYSHNLGLAYGDMYNLPDPFLIPLDIEPGFYRLGIVTDFHNVVWENESEENNSVFSDIFQINLDSTRVPDLQPVEISQQNWTSGETYTIEVTATNTSAPTGIATWIDELYISNDAGEKLAWATSIFSGHLETNENYTASFQLEMPPGIPANAKITVRIDTAQSVLEYAIANNILEMPIEVISGPTADLSPTGLVVQDQINAGLELNVALMRNNLGNAGLVNEQWIERVLLSSDDIPSENDINLRSYFLEEFPASSTEIFEDSIQIPLTLTGDYYLIYVMDANDDIHEGFNEDNNYVVSSPLTILTPPPVDFASGLESFELVDGNLESLEFSITNTSDNTFDGKFYNVFFLSTDSVYSTDDQAFGLRQIADYNLFSGQLSLGPNQTVIRTTNLSYIPVVEGNYYVIQKIDAFLNVYETDETNNTVAFGPVYLDNVQEIFADITYNKQFNRNYYIEFIADFGCSNCLMLQYFKEIYGQGPESLEADRHDYKIAVPDAFGMIVHMWEDEEFNENFGISNESQPIYEMYVGEEFIPTPLEFDYRFDAPLQSDQTILVPVAGQRTDYIKTRAPYIPPHWNPDVTPISQYYLRAEFKQFSVFSMHPEKVGTSHNVTLRIKGFDLQDTVGLDVALINQGDTVYAFETYPQSSSELIAYIDMRGYAPGDYQLMVRKQSTGAYTIWDEPVPVIHDNGAELFVEVKAPGASRSSQDFQIQVTYGNKGYSNYYDMLVFVAVFMDDTSSTGLHVRYLGSSYPGNPLSGFISDEINPAGFEAVGDLGYAMVYGARVPIVHARSRETFYFEVNGEVPGIITTQASLGLVQRSPYTFTGRTADAATSRYAVLLGQAIAAVDGVLEDLGKSGGSDCDQPLNADEMTYKLAEETYKVAKKARGASGMKKDITDSYNTIMAPDLQPAAVYKKYEAYKKLVGIKGELDLTANKDTPFFEELTDVFDCIEADSDSDFERENHDGYKTITWESDDPNSIWDTEFTIWIRCEHCTEPKDKDDTDNINSEDPNEIVGPGGQGLNRLVKGDETFQYTIYFENVADASAPARRVRIDNPLDSNLRLPSMRLVSFGFADTSFQFNEEPFVQKTVDLGAEYNDMQLRIFAGTNPLTQKAFFEFTTIDPATQGLATGAYDGFLLPNDTSGRGQGFVTYLIDPKPGLAPGTRINNQAAIVFDANEIIETNTWTNTISGGDLQSRVNELPEYSSPKFSLSWINETPAFGPSVVAFDIYYRDVTVDSSKWIRWIGETKSLNKTFEGIPGHTYEFLSRAISQNEVEVFTTTPDTRTTIIDFRGNVDGSNLVLFPNPANESTTLAYNSSGNNVPMRVNITDIRGRKLLSTVFTTTGGGIQFFRIPISHLSAGVYIVALFENDQRTGSAKLVVTAQPKK